MRKLFIVVVALAVIGAVALGVHTIGARDETEPVDSTSAARLVDDDGVSRDVSAGDRPAAGVYVYAGSGSERVDLFGGSEHIFPDEFSAVVQLDPDDACAWTFHTVYVKQHIETRHYCSSEHTLVSRSFTRKIEFFNKLQSSTYTCGDDAQPHRLNAAVGDTWSWTCSKEPGTTVTHTAHALGRTRLTIGGDRVNAWHYRVASRHSGDTEGTGATELWLTNAGFIVKFRSRMDAQTRLVLGTTRFHERLNYTLTSLVPKPPV